MRKELYLLDKFAGVIGEDPIDILIDGVTRTYHNGSIVNFYYIGEYNEYVENYIVVSPEISEYRLLPIYDVLGEEEIEGSIHKIEECSCCLGASKNINLEKIIQEYTPHQIRIEEVDDTPKEEMTMEEIKANACQRYCDDHNIEVGILSITFEILRDLQNGVSASYKDFLVELKEFCKYKKFYSKYFDVIDEYDIDDGDELKTKLVEFDELQEKYDNLQENIEEDMREIQRVTENWV